MDGVISKVIQTIGLSFLSKDNKITEIVTLSKTNLWYSISHYYVLLTSCPISFYFLLYNMVQFFLPFLFFTKNTIFRFLLFFVICLALFPFFLLLLYGLIAFISTSIGYLVMGYFIFGFSTTVGKTLIDKFQHWIHYHKQIYHKHKVKKQSIQSIKSIQSIQSIESIKQKREKIDFLYTLKRYLRFRSTRVFFLFLITMSLSMAITVKNALLTTLFGLNTFFISYLFLWSFVSSSSFPSYSSYLYYFYSVYLVICLGIVNIFTIMTTLLFNPTKKSLYSTVLANTKVLGYSMVKYVVDLLISWLLIFSYFIKDQYLYFFPPNPLQQEQNVQEKKQDSKSMQTPQQSLPPFNRIKMLQLIHPEFPRSSPREPDQKYIQRYRQHLKDLEKKEDNMKGNPIYPISPLAF